MKKLKKGISLTSMIIYVALFFLFTVFAIAMSNNMNYKAMDEKANIYILEQFSKLQNNMLDSSVNSTSVDNIYGKIVFSNNDEYVYDQDKKIILKNGGVLAKNVESFNVIKTSDLSNIPSNVLTNVDDKQNNICIEIKFKKYRTQITKQLFYTVGDDIK